MRVQCSKKFATTTEERKMHVQSMTNEHLHTARKAMDDRLAMMPSTDDDDSLFTEVCEELRQRIATKWYADHPGANPIGLMIAFH